MRAWVRAGGDRFGSDAAFHNLIAQGLGVDVGNGLWVMGIGLDMDRMDLDMEMDSLNPNQAVSSGQRRAGPVTGG